MRNLSTVKRISVLVLALVFALTAASVSAGAYTYAASAKKPAKVTGVKAAAICTSTSSLNVTWKKASNAKKYEVYQAASKSGKYSKIGTVSGLKYTAKGLKAGKKYFFKVRAVNGSKKGSLSSIVSAKTRTKTNVVAVDKKNKTVTISAKVNGKYFKESTRHLMIDQKGFNKGLAILTSYCYPDELYKGLTAIGGVSWSKTKDKELKMGEKITAKNAENKNYSSMDITISWDDKSYDLSECLTTKKGGSKAPKLNMVFSGNPKAAAKTYSGCMVCLDSCYIGIVSNDQYGLCDIDGGNPSVYARADVLPEDGTIVKVTFTLR